MSAKQESDKKTKAYPWTARQKRAVKGRRLQRKQQRKLTRNK